ncbi:hypothetical protein PHLCEN_2v4081 [Hermanssonia centrifuga]|uniref:Cytochrome P450 n=1 Tax=Hermanssonia centrifuga TaxID=98765 RepID=A0A2R6Q2C4_9APHY|nr:hypothetical protein PHLCEN_2v4081 [Hermanssonia centrifuga]
MSKISMVRVVREGKEHLYIKSLHDRYGDVVRIGVHGSPLYITKGLASRCPGKQISSSIAIHEYRPVIAKRVRQLVDKLSSPKGNTVDLAQWMGFFAASVIFEHLPWLQHLTVPGIGRGLKRLHEVAVGGTEARLERETSKRDFFRHLNNKDSATSEDIPDGVSAWIVESHTTSSVLSNLFYCLLRHPHAYARLRAEVDECYPPLTDESESDVDIEDGLDAEKYEEMPWLDAVIYLPEGNQARVHTYSIQRDPRNFSHPETFWPDRWLIASNSPSPLSSPNPSSNLSSKTNKAAAFTHNNDAFLPFFSLDPADCVERDSAIQTMRVLVCYFVKRLDVRFAVGWDPLDWEKERDEGERGEKVGRLPVVVQERVRSPHSPYRDPAPYLFSLNSTSSTSTAIIHL